MDTVYNESCESFLDLVFRKMRLKRIRKFLGKEYFCVLCDLGCGYYGRNLGSLKSYYENGIGIDSEVGCGGADNITLMSACLDEGLPLASSSVDCLISTAVLEHLNKPKEHIQECYRVLRPGGRLLLTTPSPRAKWILEFLAFRMGWILESAIRDHKHYFSRSELRDLLQNAGFDSSRTVHQFFQFGCNHFVSATKIVVGQ